jgi:hypothetical protein
MGWEEGTGAMVISGGASVAENIGRLQRTFLNSSMEILDVGHARRYRVSKPLGVVGGGSFDVTESGR